jgi:hypothetical protein
MPVMATTTGDKLGALVVNVQYDPALLQPVSCSSDPADAFDYSSCNLAYERDQSAPDTLRFNLISAAGRTGEPILAKLIFEIIGQSAEATKVHAYAEAWTERGEPVVPGVQFGAARVTEPGGQSEFNTTLSLPLILR